MLESGRSSRQRETFDKGYLGMPSFIALLASNISLFILHVCRVVIHILVEALVGLRAVCSASWSVVLAGFRQIRPKHRGLLKGKNWYI